MHIALYRWMEQYSGHMFVHLHHTDGWNSIVDIFLCILYYIDV